MSYDPEAQGARCGECPLKKDRKGGPVGPEVHPGALGSIIGDSPGKHDVVAGKPLRGPAGWELNDALGWNNRQRGTFNYHNVLACELPRSRTSDTDFNDYMRRVKAAGAVSPVACCLPRLLADLDETGDAAYNLLPLGELASQTVLHSRAGIMKLRGGPTTGPVFSARGPDAKVVATVAPGSVMRQKALREIFYSDIGRAVRHFENRLNWPPFDVLFPQDAGALWDFLWADGRPATWGWDIETNRAMYARNIRPLEVHLRCLSFARGDGTAVMVVPFLSVDHRTRFYSSTELRQMQEVIREAFLDPRRTWYGHNSRWFDQLWIENAWGFSPRNHRDTMMMHRQGWPALNHRLAILGSTLTDVPNWKSDDSGADNALVDAADVELDTGDADALAMTHQAVQARDEALWERNAIDSIVTIRTVAPMEERIRQRYPDKRCPGLPGWTLDDLDTHAQKFCRILHRTGVPVDQEIRGRAQEWLEVWAASLITEIRSEVFRLEGSVKWSTAKTSKRDPFEFNPAAAQQLGKLLYERWDLPVKEVTKSGIPSVDAKQLRMLIMTGKLPPEREHILNLIRRWKLVEAKWLGTVVRPLAPERWRVFARKESQLQPGYLSPDGRARASWNASGTQVLRYSADKPAMQIIPSAIKPIFAAPPGFLMFGADADQIHPRIIAALWKVPRLLEVFLAGEDPYGLIAEIMFGRMYTNASGYVAKKKPKGGDAKKLRDIAKTIFLAMLYGASELTVYKSLTKAENPDGSLAAKSVSFKMVVAACAAVHRAMPEIRQGWESTAREAEANGQMTNSVPWLKDPIAGFRRDFPEGIYDADGDTISSDVINFKVLTAEAALMHWRESVVLEAIPEGKWGPGTGVCIQVHDSISGQAPAEHAKWAANVVAEALTYTVPALSGMKFTAEAVFGPSLLEA